jgi:ABC-type siderophore export system fused ATPase/permease subunit
MLQLLKPFRLKLIFTLALVILESVGWILFPFLIGVAINDLINQNVRGLLLFALLGIVTLILMTARRLYDTRLYAKIYQDIAIRSTNQNTILSTKTARLNMLREIIEFFEHSMPELINSIAILFGSLIFLAILSFKVFIASLGVAILIVFIYGYTSKKTLNYNHEFNNELENQVDIVKTNNGQKIKSHIHKLNKWTIKLSDIETLNFGLTWILVILLQIFAVINSTNNLLSYGAILSIVLYVFEFSETATQIPYAWQEYLRLKDIMARVKQK